MNATEKLKIIEADRMGGDILIHFSNGMAVHYQSKFLWDARDLDGNVVIPEIEAEEDEPLVLPDEQ